MNEKCIKVKENTIHYKIKNNKHDKAIVFIHGAGKTNHTWLNQYSLNINANLIFPNLPNHGQSKGKIIQSIEEYTYIINEFLKSLSYKRYIIVGHSMGGAIALDLALNNTEILEKIIIIDSSARLKVSNFVFEAINKNENILLKWAYCKKTPRNIVEYAERDFNDVKNEIRYADFKACNNFDAREKIKDIKIPTLILVGECDKLTPPKFSEFMHLKIKNSHLKIIPESGHMSMWEKYKIINEYIIDFASST